MELFVASAEPILCAAALDLVRTEKMASRAYRVMKAVKSGKHTSAWSEWAGRTKGNYSWLFAYAIATAVEYRLRTGKPHKNIDGITGLADVVLGLPDGELTNLPTPSGGVAEGDPFRHHHVALSLAWHEDVSAGRKPVFSKHGAPPFYTLAWPLPKE